MELRNGWRCPVRHPQVLDIVNWFSVPQQGSARVGFVLQSPAGLGDFHEKLCPIRDQPGVAVTGVNSISAINYERAQNALAQAG